MFSLPKDLPEFTPFKTFQVAGYLIGGIGPLFFHCLTSMAGVERSLFSESHFSFFLVCALIGLALGIVVLLVNKEHHDGTAFKVLFFIEAMFSFFLIHVLVLATGGSKVSVFSLSYMYLPAVVGYTYGAGGNLLGATIFSLGSYFANLYSIEAQMKFMNDFMSLGTQFTTIETARGDYIYFVVFFMQLIVTAYIGWQRKHERPESIQ